MFMFSSFRIFPYFVIFDFCFQNTHLYLAPHIGAKIAKKYYWVARIIKSFSLNRNRVQNKNITRLFTIEKLTSSRNRDR